MTTSYTPSHEVKFVQKKKSGYRLTRRELLAQGLGLGGSFLVGSGFLAASSASWAMEVKALQPGTMATLVQMARDIYPHDKFGDELYAIAVQGHDNKAAEDAEFKQMMEDGVSNLDALAKAAGHPSYVDTGWEASQRPRNSVSALRPDNPLLPALLELPTRNNLPMHTIIGQRNPKKPTEKGSDGVVPYTSAHLKSASSELVVLNTSHREVPLTDECVNEVLRILYKHVGLARKATATAISSDVAN